MPWESYLPARARLGIRATVVLPLLCGTLAVTLLGLHWIEESERSQRDRHLRAQAWTLGRTMVSVATDAASPALQARLATSFTTEPGVQAVVVAHGIPLKVLAAHRPDWIGRTVAEIPELAESGGLAGQAILNGRAEYRESPRLPGRVELLLPFLRQLPDGPPARGTVIIQIDGRSIKAAQDVRTRRLCLALLCAILLLSSGMYLLVRQAILRPIEAISHFADEIAQGNRTARLAVTRHDELGRLARQIDSLFRELLRREERERSARSEAQSARERTEATLSELGSLKYALDQHAIISVIDAQGYFTHTNSKFCESSGYRRDQLAGQTQRLLDAGPYAEAQWAEIWKTLAHGIWRGELCCRAAHGTLYWVDNTIVPFRDADGQISQYVVMGTDITPRKRAEMALADRERQLRAVVNNVPGITFRCRADFLGTVLFISDQIFALTGYHPSEFMNCPDQGLLDLVHPDDEDAVRETIDEAIASGDSYSVEYRMRCRSGDYIDVWERGQAIREESGSGQAVFVDGVIRDISDRKRAEQQMANERALLLAFVEHAPAAIAMFDTDMRYLAVSRRWMTDYALEGREVIGRTHYEVFPNLPQRWKDVHARCLTGETVTNVDDVWRPEGWDRDQILHWEVRPWLDGDGTISGLMMFTEDLTVQKQTEAALRETKEQFELALRGSNDGIWDWSVLTGDVFYSQRFKDLLGYAADEFPHRFEALEAHLHPEDRQPVLDQIQRHLEEGTAFDSVCRLKTASAAWRWFRFRGEAVRNEEGRARRMAGSLSDISSLKQVEEQLLQSARMDQLTGLPNRALFLDRLSQQMQRALRTGHHGYAVMFLDFDRFKIVNDSLGHDAGDALLVQIAGRMREQIRCVDSVSCNVAGSTTARLGGDEFVVLLADLRAPDDARLVAERLMAALSRPYQIGQHEVYSTASIGIVAGSSHYTRPEELVRDADTAMYEAKRNGKSRYVLFDASMHERVRRRMQLETDLHRAIAENQLFLMFQPIFDLKTRAMQSVEALVRWQHPEEGLISPGEFIPIAEESALILSIGDWVLREACRRFAEWRKMLGAWAPPSVSINVSRKQFSRNDLPDLVRSAMHNFNIEPSGIQLEVTEDFFASDVKSAVRAMKAIKSLGVKLAIDDFGTGCSSFASLHQFPADTLKIDRSLISEISRSEDAVAMIQGLTSIAQNLDVKIVAEGIETAEQAAKLLELGCDYAQGFYFARPLLNDQLIALQMKTCQDRAGSSAESPSVESTSASS